MKHFAFLSATVNLTSSVDEVEWKSSSINWMLLLLLEILIICIDQKTPFINVKKHLHSDATTAALQLCHCHAPSIYMAYKCVQFKNQKTIATVFKKIKNTGSNSALNHLRAAVGPFLSQALQLQNVVS